MGVFRIDDVGRARQGCRVGAGAAGFVALVTLIAVLASLTGVQAVPGATIDLLALVDVVLFAGVAWGLLRRSRVAALGGLGLFVFEKLSMPPPAAPLAWAVMLGLGGCFAWSLLCAFGYHRLRRVADAALPENAVRGPAV